MSRSKHGPAAGAPGGATPRPTKLLPPEFIRLQRGELHALFNLAGHELAGSVYLLLIAGSVFKGKHAGEFLGSYARLQALLRPPRPERGQWAPPPTLKRVRGAIDALQAAGLVHRDAEANQAQGQLRLQLTLRGTDAKSRADEDRTTRHAIKANQPRPATGIPADVRAKLAEAAQSLRRAPRIKGQG